MSSNRGKLVLMQDYVLKTKRVTTSLFRLAVLLRALTTIYSMSLLSIVLLSSARSILNVQ
jgi:hypothetical protein